MQYTDFLSALHEKKNGVDLYFEIGVRQGRSLNLSRAKRNIGVDPDFNVTWPLSSPTVLFKQESDDFFATNAAKVFDRPIDISFIDGMHLSEFALRDFMNVEKHCRHDSIVMLDDVLPYKMEIATRTRNTSEWTGDIYKLIEVLRHYRPDLTIEVIDIDIKGLMLISHLDPTSDVLSQHYDEIEAYLMRDDVPVVSAEELRAMADPAAPEEGLKRL